jgi:hypothetical protein
MHAYQQSIAMIEMAVSCAVICIWIVRQLLTIHLPFTVRVIAVLILSNFFFWPLGSLGISLELPLAAYVRGVIGDLSIFTLLLLWSSLLPKEQLTPVVFKVTVLCFAVMFYPVALGYGMLDPYAWGYHSYVLLSGVILFTVICGLAGWTKGVWIFSLAIIAWSVHWHESSNLWDYLIDPLLVIWTLCSLMKRVLRKRGQRAQNGYLFRAG